LTPPPKKLPKKKLKDFFKDLQEDWKVMIAELNLVCAECRYKMDRKNETIKTVDVVTAI
jgi:hypothetical protein